MKSVIEHTVEYLALLLLLSPVALRAQTGNTAPDTARRDSVVMQTTFYFSPGNGEWIERADYPVAGRLVRWAQANPDAPIIVTGWADASGTAALNEKLSLRRARTIRNYLVQKGVAADRITFEGAGVDTQAESTEKARRADVCGVVRIAVDVPPATAPDGGAIFPPPAQNAESLAADGVTAPRTEQTAPPASGDAHDATIPAVPSSITHTPDSSTVSTVQTGQHSETEQAGVRTGTDTSVHSRREPISAETAQTVSEPYPVTPANETPSAGRYLGVKTNLAAWAGTIMNVAADVQVGRHWSVELPVLWCPWYVSDKHAIKTFTIQPEGRFWLSKPGAGHFFGVHAHIGWFNVKWNRDRYQDADRPLLGAGISYGYLLPFNEHWAGEFTLGAGYANMRYDTFYNMDNGARIDTRTKNYWGITRVGISVVYRFNLKK